MSDKRIIWPVLMVDAEWGDIGDLDGLLEQVGTRMAIQEDDENADYVLDTKTFREYVSHPGEAVERMFEKMHERGRYSAIITDNHMCDENGEGIFGEQFLRIIKGKLVYCSTKDESDAPLSINDMPEVETFRELLEYEGRKEADEEMLDFMEDNFANPAQYRTFVNYHFDNRQDPLLIMLCGHPRDASLVGIEDEVYLIHKRMRHGKNGAVGFCEEDILQLLGERKIIPEDFARKSIEEHYRLGEGVHPTQKLFKDPNAVKKKKRKKR